jgi:hypothetical protein
VGQERPGADDDASLHAIQELHEDVGWQQWHVYTWIRSRQSQSSRGQRLFRTSNEMKERKYLCFGEYIWFHYIVHDRMSLNWTRIVRATNKQGTE